MKKLNIAVVGLGFGDAFVKIYAAHPFVGTVTLCDTNETRLAKYAGNDNIVLRTSLDAVLADDAVDAVHIVTPIPLHAEQSVAVLQSGKHCACAVPMATSVEEIRKIEAAVRDTGKIYMLMETTLYTYQYLYAADMLRRGAFGRVQFLRGSHYQDMSDWPSYWSGLPPMWYGTHAIAPLIGLSSSRVKRVTCFGSGSMSADLAANYGNPYPVETAVLEFRNGLKAEATRSLFETVREYREGFSVYGSDACFEWGYRDDDDPYVTYKSSLLNGSVRAAVTQMPNSYKTLPKELWRFTVGDRYDENDPERSLELGKGGGHHGAHAHLVHEFVRGITENVPLTHDFDFAVNLTYACILAHESAMCGKTIEIPDCG